MHNTYYTFQKQIDIKISMSKLNIIDELGTSDILGEMLNQYENCFKVKFKIL